MDRRLFLAAVPAAALAGCATTAGTPGPPAPAPVFRVGDRWVYQVADGFRVKSVWTETHEVTSLRGTGFEVRVTIAGGGADMTRVERWDAPGVMASGSVFDHTETRDFQQPAIIYRFPLTPGDSWTQNLRNLNPANQLVSTINRSVRVGGYQNVSVPAGAFDALALRILMSVDDNDPFRFPFQCNYELWYGPAVGAMVRMTRRATVRERGETSPIVGDTPVQYSLAELVSYRRGGS
jgi:hypothetical protein